MRAALILLVLTGAAFASPAEDGATAFWASDFAKAAKAFREVTASAPESVDAWYNLGTAEAQAGRLGPAIHALEQARLLDPGDDDARHNLSEVRALAVERSVGRATAGRVILPGDDDVGTGLLTALSPQSMGAVFALAWALLFGLLMVRRLNLKAGFKTAVGLAAVLAGLVVLGSGSLLLSRISLGRSAKHAVVVSDSAPALVGPGERYKVVAQVLGGVRLKVRGSEGDFTQVTLPDGGEGWMARRHLADLQVP